MNGITAQSLAAVLAILATFNEGLLAGWSSPSIPKLLSSDSDLTLTADQSSWVISFLNFGTVFGPVVMLLLVDRIGRKLTLLFSVVPILLCWVMVALVTNYQWLYAARFIGGIGYGTIRGTAPMYLGEMSEDRIRGRVISLIWTSANAGVLYEWSIGPWVSRQMLSLASIIPIVIFIITFSWMPETPYYYLMKGKQNAARSSLLWLRRRNDVEDELASIQESVYSKQQNRINLIQLIANPGNRRAMFISVGLLSFQNLAGTLAITAYASTILEQSGFSLSENASGVIFGIFKLFAGVLALSTVDSLGRRPVLMFSAIGTFLCLMAEAIFFNLQANGYDVSSFAWLPLVGLLGYCITHASGLGSLGYVVLGEVFATDVKASAMMVTSMYLGLLGMLVTKTYQVVADAFGTHVAFYGYATFTFVGIFFIYFCVPETKNRSLQDINDELHRRDASKVEH